MNKKRKALMLALVALTTVASEASAFMPPIAANNGVGYYYEGQSFKTGLYQQLSTGPQLCAGTGATGPLHVAAGQTYDLLVGAVDVDVLVFNDSALQGASNAIFTVAHGNPQTITVQDPSWNPTILFSAYDVNNASFPFGLSNTWAAVRVTAPQGIRSDADLTAKCSTGAHVSATEGQPAFTGATGLHSVTAGVQPTWTNKTSGSCGTCQPYTQRTPNYMWLMQNRTTDVTPQTNRALYSAGSVGTTNLVCGNYTSSKASWESNCGVDSYAFTWNWSAVNGPRTIVDLDLTWGWNANWQVFNISFIQADGTRVWLGNFNSGWGSVNVINTNLDCSTGCSNPSAPMNVSHEDFPGINVPNAIALKIVAWAGAAQFSVDWFDVIASETQPADVIPVFNDTTTPSRGYVGGYPLDVAGCAAANSCRNVTLMAFNESNLTDNADPVPAATCAPDPATAAVPSQVTLYINATQYGDYYSTLFKKGESGQLTHVGSAGQKLLSTDAVHFTYTYPSNRQSLVFGGFNDTGSYVLAIADSNGALVNTCRFTITAQGITPGQVGVDDQASSAINSTLAQYAQALNATTAPNGADSLNGADSNFIYGIAEMAYSDFAGIPWPYLAAMLLAGAMLLYGLLNRRRNQ